jgi:CysZ protein
MTPITTKTFVRGARAAWEGVRVAVHDPDVRKAYLQVVLGMLVLTLVIDALGLWGLFAWIDPSTADSAIMGAVQWLLRIVGAVVVLMVGPLVALLIMNIAFPLFSEPVFMAGLRAQDPERAARVAAGPGMPLSVSAGIAAVRLARFIGWTIVFLLVGLVPFVGGIIGMLGQAWLTARTAAWEMMDPYFDRLDIRWAGQREFYAKHRDVLLGFGLPLGVMLAIPLIGPLLFGWAQGAAGTLLVREIPPHPREFQTPGS